MWGAEILNPSSIMMGLSAKASGSGVLGANSFLGHCLIACAILGLHACVFLLRADEKRRDNLHYMPEEKKSFFRLS